jgi:hypothetical protein
MRPRLEPDREYVFSDFHPARVDVNPLQPARHNEDWALSRSANRSSMSLRGIRLLVVVIVVVLLLGVIGYFARDRVDRGPSTTTTHVTTTTHHSTTTTRPTSTTTAG